MNRGVVGNDADWRTFNSLSFPIEANKYNTILPSICGQFVQMISTTILFMKAECHQDVIMLHLARPARPCDTAS